MFQINAARKIAATEILAINRIIITLIVHVVGETKVSGSQRGSNDDSYRRI
jgi:hypothetical protein